MYLFFIALTVLYIVLFFKSVANGALYDIENIKFRILLSLTLCVVSMFFYTNIVAAIIWAWITYENFKVLRLSK